MCSDDKAVCHRELIASHNDRLAHKPRGLHFAASMILSNPARQHRGTLHGGEILMLAHVQRGHINMILDRSAAYVR